MQALYQQFEKIFKQQYNLLANYAWSVLRNKEDAEDVVQEVFTKIWQNNPTIFDTDHVRFYLQTAIKNACISLLRKQAGKSFMQPEEVRLYQQLEEYKHTEQKDIFLMVQEALALLPPQCQAIFKLSRFGNLTYQQIAEELELSVKTVENQMGKALRIMRDYSRKNEISFILLLAALGWTAFPFG